MILELYLFASMSDWWDIEHDHMSRVSTKAILILSVFWPFIV
jgi:hypothetical protein